MTIPDLYNVHRNELVQLLSKFEKRWDGLIPRIKTVKHKI